MLKRITLFLTLAFFLLPGVSFAQTFTRPLFIGSEGVDVSTLQTYLKSKSYFTYPTITGFYGAVTWKAVASFQFENGLESVGVVGPKTRALLNTMLRAGTSATTTAPTLPAQAATSSATTIPPFIAPPVNQNPSDTFCFFAYCPGNGYTPGFGGGGGGGGGGGVTAPSDTTAPNLSSIASSSVTATSATISWTTDEAGATKVFYGLTSSYGTTVSNASLVTSHTINLSGLSSDTVYHFSVQSVDAAGNATTSADYSFTTQPSWVKTNAAVDIDFANSRYYGGTLGNLISLSRASVAYASNIAGDLISFSSNTPRITDQGLLIENQATNIMLRSNFSSGWTVGNSTITANSATSPDGTSDAAYLKEDSSTNGHDVTAPTVTKPAVAQTYTLSFYAKRVGSPRNLQIFMWDGSFSQDSTAYFNLGTGISQTGSGSGGADFTNIGSICVAASQSYWRCSWTFITPAVANLIMQFKLMNATGDPNTFNYSSATYTGNNTAGIYLYGPQVEQGTFASSYIPTVASAVTRAADVVTISGAAQNVLASTMGTAVVTTTGGNTYSTTTNLIDSNGTTLLGFTSGDVLATSLGSTLSTTNTAHRFVVRDNSAVAWDGVGRTLVLNGGTSVTDSVAQNPSSTLKLGSTGTNKFLNGYVSRMTLWSSKLSNPKSMFTLTTGTDYLGVFVAGAQGPTTTSGSIFPNTSDWDYLQSKGFKQVRLSLAWENLQPTLNGALNASQVSSIQTALSRAAARGMNVVLDIQNYGYYANPVAWGYTVLSAGNNGSAGANVYQLGDSNLTTSAFADLWSRMATAFVGTSGLGGYELMNEPSTVGTSTWPTAAQGAINAIRLVDTTTPIHVAGYTNTLSGYGASTYVPPIVTGTNLVYDAHQYFDGPQGIGGGGTYSGNYASYSIDNYSAVKTILPWLGWLKMNGYSGTLGEYGIPDDELTDTTEWLKLQNHFEALLVQQGIPAWQTFYGSGSGVAGNGATLQINPKAGIDDARVTDMMGQF